MNYEFIAKYGKTIYICYFFSLILLLVLFVTLIVFGEFFQFKAITITSSLILILLFPLIIVKKFEFKDKIYIYYFFGRVVTKEYYELTDFGKTSIRFNKLNIPIVYMKNSGNLLSILEDLINNGVIDRNQIKKTLVKEEKNAFKYSIIAIIITYLIIRFGNKYILNLFSMYIIKDFELFYTFEFIILFMFFYFLLNIIFNKLIKNKN